MAEEFDVITIGAGPGGYVAAIRAAQLGLKSACVEAEALGGVCLNWGCIPNGVLLYYADFVSRLRNHARDFGFTFEGLETDYAAAVERSRVVVQRLTRGVGGLFKKYDVTHIRGCGRLTDPHTVEVNGTAYRAKHIILATGATWNRLADVGVEGEEDGERVVAYRDAVVQKEAPGSVVVVGGGIIGVEFSYTYRAYGASVTLIEQSSQLLPRFDDEVAAALEGTFRKQGITVRTGTALRKVERVGEKVRVTVAPAEGGEAETLEADRVLLAIGVKANSRGLGLEALGVEMDRWGNVVVDEAMRTSVPHIYAVGDVTGKRPFASVAIHMALAAVDAIAGHPHKPLDYRMMPRIAYCNPQAASVGYTEEELRERGIPYKAGRYPLIANGKALGRGEADGFVKVLSRADGEEMLGMHAFAPEAGELMAEFSIARELEALPVELARAVHPHPTISEAIGEAAMASVGLPLSF